MVGVDHRVGGRGAFTQVDDRLRLDLFEEPVHYVLVVQVALNQVRTPALSGLEGVELVRGRHGAAGREHRVG